MQRVFILLCASLCVIAVYARPFNVPIPTLVKASKAQSYAHLFESFNAKNDPNTARWRAAGVNTLRFDDLKTSGQATRTPWPGSYWPAYQDSINFRWAGLSTMSPASKYARAFLGNPQLSNSQLTDIMQKFEDSVSTAHGTGLGGNAQQCFRENDPVCGARSCGLRTMVNTLEHQQSGQCVDGWAGICHGWSPAAVSEVEPQRSVSYNNIIFQIPDLKGLLSASYTSTQSLSLGFKCDSQGGGNGELDAAGRVDDLMCRDVNPGGWHVVIANLLGAGQSLVEDRTYDLQIWNQPIKGFSSTNNDVEIAQAHRMLNLGSVNQNSYYYNEKAAKLKYVKMRLDYVSECDSSDSRVLAGQFITQDVYEYILELDASGNVIGGEWLPSSQRNHPDFIWTILGFGPMPVQDLKLADVQFLNNLTQIPPNVNVCATNNGGCDSKAVCSSSYQSQYLALTCTCRPGYTGNGRQCAGNGTDVNACAINNGGCPQDSTCSLDMSNQVACSCQQGFYWNKNVQPNLCSDVNECANNNGGCAQVCTNSYGGFKCSCATGYLQGNSSCSDVNECALPTTCPDVHSTCVNNPGSYECMCNSGYVRLTPTAMCTPEQPPIFKNCSDRLSNTCDPATSTCVDAGPGMYYCKCFDGYVSSSDERGKTLCVPVNPCATNNGGCHARASCARLANGNVQCTCMPGLLGDGHLCYPEFQRPVHLDVNKCTFSPNCPAFSTSNTTLGEAMREEQHLMLLFNRFTISRSTMTVQPVLNCQFACVMPLSPGWSVNMKSATLSGSATVMAGGSLRGYVEMWLSGGTPNPPSLDMLVANTASSTMTAAFSAHHKASPNDWQNQGTCSGDSQVLVRGWIVLQFSGALGSSVTINSVDPNTGEYDWNGAGFDWQMEWKKC